MLIVDAANEVACPTSAARWGQGQNLKSEA
jgi:hypothetical protein